MHQFFHVMLPALGGVAIAAALATGAAAQSFPSKPVRIVVGFAPGGAADTLARSTTPKLTELLAQPVIVENRPGAGGVIGADNVAKSPADGHTVLLAAINHYLVPFFKKSVPYETVKDFVPVVILADGFSVLAVHPSVPVNSMADLIAYAKKNPGKLSYGTVGIGSLHHLGGVLLEHAAGIQMEHVPYKGGSPTINDVLGGTLPMAILNVATIMPHARSGKLRALGLIDAKRSRTFPDVPTIGETIPGFAAPGQWFGIIGPSAMPASTVARLNGDFRKAIAEPEVQKRMASLGFEVAGNTPEEFAARVRSDNEVIRKAVTAAGIKPE
jgi:tripartite-type tricarboxylate transporter receptor subunit TctC